MPFKQRLQGGQREIKHMLVIDRVELAAVQKIHRVREFENDTPLGFERPSQALYEVVGVGDVGQDVVAQDQVGLLPFVHQLPRQRLSEKLGSSGDALGLGDLGDVGGRLD